MGKVVFKINIVLALLVLSSCATTRDRFPDYGEAVKTHSSAAIILDLFVYRDIAGSSRGVNKGFNQESLDTAVVVIDEFMTERGFSTQALAKLNGLTYEIKKDKDYVVSENWESTGEPYNALLFNEGDNPWMSQTTQEFFKGLVTVAQEINAKKNEDQYYVENELSKNAQELSEVSYTFLNEFDIPLLNEFESDVVLFVKVEGCFQKFSKFLFTGLLTGVVTNLLVGPLTVIPPGSYMKADAVAFNIETRKILWHGSGYAEGRNSVRSSIESALSQYPYSNGETAPQKKRNGLRAPNRVRS